VRRAMPPGQTADSGQTKWRELDTSPRQMPVGAQPARQGQNTGKNPVRAIQRGTVPMATPPRKIPPKQNRLKKEKNNLISSLISRLKGKNEGHPLKEPKRFELARKAALIGFSVLSFAAVIICTVIGYSYSGDSIRIISQMTESERSSSREYIIVYSESDPWGLNAATALRDLFMQKTGASLKIVTDAESVAKHEIRVGHTNRSGDDYLTTLAALGTDGYAVILQSGDNISIAALSENGANTAVKYFVNSYVGSYRTGKLTLMRNMSISFVSRSGEEPSISLRESKITLNFTETGKFRVLVFSDADINPNTIAAINAMAETEKPHLVLFAGDVSSGMTAKADLEAYLRTLTAPLEERAIPWAAVFGEQDTDGGLSAEAQMEVYTSFEHCVAKSDFVSDGTVSYFLPVYAAGEGGSGTAPVFGIWAMGQTGMLSLTSGGAASDPLLEDHRENGTDYGYVTSSQIAWFTKNQKVLDREAGGAMPTVMVCHTPIPEFAIIADNPDETRMLGNAGEPVASSPLNSGLFAAILEAKNVLGLYCGHDHLNSFAGRYCGIELGYSASIGYDGYGFGGTFDINNSLRGGRMIELTLKDGAVTSSSRMVYASDYGIGLN
ncbi:MAG: metallophosphoesterase, partial [Clostridia bacterium]|nr:metallophosphoesterase [Clostridia bacterium]